MEYIIITAVFVIILVVLYFHKKMAMKNGLCVFMYHRIGKIGSEDVDDFFVSDELFSQQLDLLATAYHPMRLSEVEDCYINKKPLPKNAVLLTFDDGYLNNYQYAYPLALKKKIPITIFLSTGEISAKKEMLTWKQVDEMSQSNLVEFSSHGVNHKRLRKLSDEDALFELTESKTELEEKLQKSIQSFCYPYGAFDERVRRLVLQAGYIMDFGTRKGINIWPWNGTRPLLRAHVMKDDNLADFQKQLKTGHKKGIMSWLF